MPKCLKEINFKLFKYLIGFNPTIGIISMQNNQADVAKRPHFYRIKCLQIFLTYLNMLNCFQVKNDRCKWHTEKSRPGGEKI